MDRFRAIGYASFVAETGVSGAVAGASIARTGVSGAETRTNVTGAAFSSAILPEPPVESPSRVTESAWIAMKMPDSETALTEWATRDGDGATH